MKIWSKRTWAAVVWLITIAFPVCALDVRYGPFFTVKGVSVKQGKLELPLARKKYANVRILDEETYRWVLSCAPQSCVWQNAAGATQIESLRAAQMRPGMWIAQVAVDERWVLTFLVFENPDGFGFVVPQEVEVKDRSWQTRTEQQIAAEIRRLKEEEKNEM